VAVFDDVRGWIADLQWWAGEERRRAAQQAAVAAGYQQRAAALPGGGGWLERAAIHRRAEACHRAAAELHDRRAARLRAQLAAGAGPRPGLVTVTAAALGLPSLAIVLLDGRRAVAAAAASDATARAAQDLEALLGEGPVHALAGMSAPIRAAGPGLARRWSRYGPALAGLGVQAVLAVPLPPAGQLGALCAYTGQPAIPDQAAAAAARIAAALGRALAQAPARPDDKADSALRHLGLPDDQAVIHQAAGMVAVHCRCSTGDALALLTARAFASSQPLGQVAHAVVYHRLRLD